MKNVQHVGSVFTGLTVCPPLLAFGKRSLNTGFPLDDVNCGRTAFSLKCIAARYNLKDKTNKHKHFSYCSYFIIMTILKIALIYLYSKSIPFCKLTERHYTAFWL